MIYAFLLLSLASSLPNQTLAHGDPHTHEHHASSGGPLLRGYPWGIFGTEISIPKRVIHKQNDYELNLANRIFEELAKEVSVSFPLHLETEGYKPFGDGQSNGQANFGKWWNSSSIPLISVLDRKKAKLLFKWSEIIDKNTNAVLVRNPNGEIQKISRNEDNEFSAAVDIVALGWDKLDNGKVLYVKPETWQDWFAVLFQSPYVDIKTLANLIPEHRKRSRLPNPLGADAQLSTPPLIQLQELAVKSGYDVYTADLVHSVYPSPNHPNMVHKSSGGNWTYLLQPKFWSGQGTQTFKQLYSCFSGRSYWEEAARKSVSGTGWHLIGDSGEIILNSIENEDRILVTAIGETVTTPPQALGLLMV